MPYFLHTRLCDILISLAIAGGILSVTCLRLTAAQSASQPAWIKVQKHQQRGAANASAIRYLCVNHMAFELDQTGNRLVPGEDKIIFADEATKRRCRLPWMPLLGAVSTVMSAVSPASGYGAAFVTTDDNPAQVMQSIHRAGWRETEASKRVRRSHVGYRGHVFIQSGAWMLVLLKTKKKSNQTTAILAGQWDPGTMEQP